MENTKLLKENDDTRSIFINNDLTPVQATEAFNLRLQRRKDKDESNNIADSTIPSVNFGVSQPISNSSAEFAAQATSIHLGNGTTICDVTGEGLI